MARSLTRHVKMILSDIKTFFPICSTAKLNWGVDPGWQFTTLSDSDRYRGGEGWGFDARPNFEDVELQDDWSSHHHAKRIFLKLSFDTSITGSPTLTFPWQPVFDSHVFWNSNFLVLINIFYGFNCYLCFLPFYKNLWL